MLGDSLALADTQRGGIARTTFAAPASAIFVQNA
jgi:hypothetical protein